MTEPTPEEVLRDFLDDMEQQVWEESYEPLNFARAALDQLLQERDRLRAELDEARAREDRLDEAIRGAIDCVTGWTRPMTDSEKLAAIEAGLLAGLAAHPVEEGRDDG